MKFIYLFLINLFFYLFIELVKHLFKCISRVGAVYLIAISIVVIVIIIKNAQAYYFEEIYGELFNYVLKSQLLSINFHHLFSYSGCRGVEDQPGKEKSK